MSLFDGLVQRYVAEREKYGPDRIRLLLIAESPPALGGYFYSEETKEGTIFSGRR